MCALLLLASVAALIPGASVIGKAASPEECSSTNKSLYLRLSSDEKQKKITFKCGGGTPDLVPGDDTHACEDSSCHKRIPLAGIASISRDASQGHTLTIDDQAQAQTIYFNCISKGDTQGSTLDSLSRSAGGSPEEVCKVQVAVWGKPKPQTPESVTQCNSGKEAAPIDLKKAPASVVFSCGSGSTISPLNFEQALKNESSDKLIELKEVLPTAKLVENGASDKVPIYTLSFEELPKQDTSFYYKCTYQADRASPSAAAASECKVVVNVAAAPQHALPGDGSQTPPTATSTSYPISSAKLHLDPRVAGASAVYIALLGGIPTL
ncbi:SAG-related sequence [Besnoitia besnoiti]|uniref:SAG-related sequence n=1 Tax=Besnoitia besnoiti TaxID=94643 RepID=A0A2A9MMF4_BESBE|nr:SAG-related sequence [Besnoitia besnoiti]PFH36973.1 SAG-related sequence [Besnoitia besnoiti]